MYHENNARKCLIFVLLTKTDKGGETTTRSFRSFSESEGWIPVTHQLFNGLEPNVFLEITMTTKDANFWTVVKFPLHNRNMTKLFCINFIIF